MFQYFIRYSSVSMLMLILFMFSIGIQFSMAQELSIWEKIQARVTGPFHFRLILQPLIAIILGIRDGRIAAKAGKRPIFLHMVTSKDDRLNYLKQVWRAIVKPLVIGIILDMIVQFIIFKSVRIWGAILLGAIIIALPYALSLGLSNRYFRQKV